MRAGFAFLLIVFCLSGCGTFSFRTKDLPAPIVVQPITGHLGQILRSDLNDTFYSSKTGTPYTLSVVLTQAEVGRQAIQKDATPTRITTAITANFTLSYDGKAVLTDATTVRGSSNVMENTFASYTSTKSVEERLIHVLSENISTRVFAYFKAHENQ